MADSKNDHFKLVAFQKGTVLYREGDSNNGKMYVIREGIVSAKRTISGKEQVVFQCAPGDIVGEVSFLTGEPRTASCIVATPEARLLELTNDTFEEMICDNPILALKVIRSLADKLRSIERRTEQA